MKQKYDLEGIERVIEDCDATQRGYFCCILLQNRGLLNELNLFESIFLSSGPTTFGAEFYTLEGRTADSDEIKQIRLLALSFLYEICRLENNRKVSGF